MPTTEMVAMVAVVAALALGFIHLLRLIGTAIKYKAMRKLVEADPGSAAILLEKLGEESPRAGDDRLATILVAIGIAMAAGVVIAVDDPGIVRAGIAASLFPLLVGAALWLRLYLAERRRRASGQ